MRWYKKWEYGYKISELNVYNKMTIENIPFQTTDWNDIETTEHKGITGIAYWRTRHFGSIRVRMVEYSSGYFADYWCSKGHIILCLEGEMTTELEDGRTFVLQKGMTYQVADNADAHRSFTDKGAKLFIVD
jgi:quercetin dioxygenase-like cupin family protein